MNFDDAVAKVKRLQLFMGYDFGDPLDPECMRYIRDVFLATHIELTEAINEIPWKPWKRPFWPVGWEDKVADELCDVIEFTLVLWVSLGLDKHGLSLDKSMEQVFNKIEGRIRRGNYGNS